MPPDSERWLHLGPATIGLIVLDVAGSAVLTWQPGLVGVLGLASGRDTVAQQPRTVVTVMFTSGHLLHLAAAVGIILFLAGAVERRLGSLHLLGIYLLSGAAGSVAVATASSAGAGNAEVSVGASAAFLGLLGAVTAGPASPLVERLQLSKVVGVVLVVNLALPVLGIGYWTNSVAHVAGIAVGALYGYVLRTRSSTDTGAIPASIHQPSSAGERKQREPLTQAQLGVLGAQERDRAPDYPAVSADTQGFGASATTAHARDEIGDLWRRGGQ